MRPSHRPPADREHHRRHAVDAEMERLVLEAITSVGGRVTPEGLVIIPGRPGWPFDAKLTLMAINPKSVNQHQHVQVTDTKLRDKAMMFIDQFACDRWKCDDRTNFAIVIAEDLR